MLSVLLAGNFCFVCSFIIFNGEEIKGKE